jgi:hypothetical protein
MLHVDSPHPNCAYMWLEHSLSPKLQGDLAAWFGSNPAVPAACKGNALLTDEGCKTNGFEDFDKVKFWKTPVSNAPRRATSACPTTAGCPTTSPLSADAESSPLAPPLWGRVAEQLKRSEKSGRGARYSAVAVPTPLPGLRFARVFAFPLHGEGQVARPRLHFDKTVSGGN